MFVFSEDVIIYGHNDRLNIGCAENIEARLCQHNSGMVQSTKAYRPWIVIREEFYSDKRLALKRERFLKSGLGRRGLKNLIKDIN